MGKTFQVGNDGYGYLTASFPETYPKSYIEAGASDRTLSAKIQAIIKSLTLDEKISLLSADGVMGQHTSVMTIDKSYGTGYWAGAARVGVPVMRCYDGPMGVRGNSGFETTRPSSEISAACTFDKELLEKYGAIYAADNKASAGNMQLGIQVDLVRTLATGRARDMFGEDWYLASELGSAMAAGLEKNNVLACLKHCGGMGNIDEQTMMETHLSIYERLLKTDKSAHTVMTNYGSSNGQQACADKYVLQKVMRELWGWKGIVLTDWGGNYQFTVDKGVTMETPSDDYNNRENVMAALKNGTLTEAQIDEAVGYNLYAMGKIGYLGMVNVSRDGGAACDSNPPVAIELPEVTNLTERVEILDTEGANSLEIAQAGIVLLKNENNTLPLGKRNENIALIGFSATHTIAGHMHECAFGRLKDLAISPYKALSSLISNVSAYTAIDSIGTPVPGKYLFVDGSGSVNGVKRTGTDGFGKEVTCIDDSIDFTTDSTDYLNSTNGRAFPYGEQGAQFTWTTYLKTAETGIFELRVEAMAASEIEAEIEINGKTESIGAAGGDMDVGFFGSSGIVSSETGLDIPQKSVEFGMPFGGGMPMPEGMNMPGGGPAFMRRKNGKIEFELEKNHIYKITVKASGNIAKEFDYLRGQKDMQVRLAWVTPSQRKNNYASALEAAAKSDTTVVFFAHELEKLAIESSQRDLLKDVLTRAKTAGNSTVLVLTSALPVDISKWVNDFDSVVAAWLPGQSGGSAIANVLAGKYNPTGRLCVTWPKRFDADQSALNTPGRGVLTPASHPGANISTEIREGIFAGYKWYDATERDDDVLFDFGHGLSYTGFDRNIESVSASTVDIDDYGFDIAVKVKNTGKTKGADVVQLYIEAPETGTIDGAVFDPRQVAASFRYVDDGGGTTDDYAKAAYFPQIDGVQFAKVQLCGFAKTPELLPGEDSVVTIHISQRSLSYWNAAGEYNVRRDGTRDKWTVVFGNRGLVLADGSDKLISKVNVVVEKNNAGPVVSFNAPLQTNVGQVVEVEAVMKDEVIGLQLEDDSCVAVPFENLTVKRNANSSVWKMYVVAARPGTLCLKLLYKGWDGWLDAKRSVNIDVLDSEPEILSVSANEEIVRTGDTATFSVAVAGGVSSIIVYDELGKPVEALEVGRSVNDDGTQSIAVNIKAKAIGNGLIFRFIPVGQNGIETGLSGKAAITVLPGNKKL